MYSLRLLGGICLEGPSGPPSGRLIQRRRLAILAILATARSTGVTRDKLIGYLWSETPSDRARHLLADSIYVLRLGLGHAAIEGFGETLRLNRLAIASDVSAFEEALDRGALEEAISLYTGPFLDGFYISDAPEFERWVDSERQRLARDYAHALESLAEADEEAGNHIAAVEHWRELTAHDPYNSRAAVRLMQALAAAGDLANALQHSQEHAHLLVEDLDIEPPAEVVHLADRLREESRESSRLPSPRSGSQPASGLEEAAGAQPSDQLGTDGCQRVNATLLRSTAARLAQVATIIGAVLVAGLFITDRVSVSAERPSIAVLPLVNLSADPEGEFFADRLHELVLAELSRIDELRVTSRTSVMEFRDQPRNVREISEELNVDNVLEGSAWRDGSRISVTVQLIDARNDATLWAETYDREDDDLWAVQRDITLDIVGSLEIELGPTQLARIEAPPTQNPDAWDYYLRASANSGKIAQRMYAKAIELDPEFALAHAMLSRSHAQAYYSNRDPARLVKARQSAETALEIDPDLPEAHRALGLYYYWGHLDYDRALLHYRNALTINPSDADSYRQIALVLRRQGRFQEALAALDSAVQLDPRNVFVFQNIATTCMYMRKYQEAERALDRAIELEPGEVFYYDLKARTYLNWRGDSARARRSIEEGRKWAGMTAPLFLGSFGWPTFRILHDPYQDVVRSQPLEYYAGDSASYYLRRAQSYRLTDELAESRVYYDSARVVLQGRSKHSAQSMELGIAYAGLGMVEEAIRAGRAAVEMTPLSADAVFGPSHIAGLAEIYVMVGQYEAAIDQLEILLSIPFETSARLLRIDPIWDPVRQHPRFQALLEKYK